MHVKSRGKSRLPQADTTFVSKEHQESSGDFEKRFEFRVEKLLLISLIVRISSVLLVQTSFVPDEYWQSLEVAHLKVFGYGYATWEWIEGIRGYAYPMVFSILYQLLSFLKLDYAILLIVLPRVLQACLSVYADISLFIFSERLFGRTIAFYSYALQLSSWFVFYTGSRTLTNTTEMALVLIALGSYNWKIFHVSLPVGQKSSIFVGLLSAGLSCIIRPSAATLWLPIAVFELYFDTMKRKSVSFFKCGTIMALVLFSMSTMIDYLFYGELIIVHWRFIKFNILQNMSGFYGRHQYHWYITQGLPVVLFTHLPLVLCGIYDWKEKTKTKIALLVVISTQLISLSFVEHKEFRFLLPIMPLMVCLAANGLFHSIHMGNVGASALRTKLYEKSSQSPASRPSVLLQPHSLRSASLESTSSLLTPSSPSLCFSSSFVQNRKGFCIFAVILVLNSLLALYTGLFHQRGTIDVMKYLRNNLTGDERKDSVLFLMPCHSTPYYSYIHMNISMRFLRCEPSLQTGYVEEADLFYSNSSHWLNDNYSSHLQPMPSHIVVYNGLLEDSGVTSFFRRESYIEVETG